MCGGDATISASLCIRLYTIGIRFHPTSFQFRFLHSTSDGALPLVRCALRILQNAGDFPEAYGEKCWRIELGIDALRTWNVAEEERTQFVIPVAGLILARLLFRCFSARYKPAIYEYLVRTV